MEPANIDWKKIQSIYIEDEIYEHINAPKFVDFTAPDDPVDDEAWFCKPDCRHPKTAEDFLRSFPNSKTKKLRSACVLEPLPLGDRNSRDNYLKRRAHISPSISSSNGLKRDFHEDCENQNPNLSTPPPNYQTKPLKSVFKSSSEKKKKTPFSHFSSDLSQENQKPQLRSTLSARNLFGGKDILNQITEFCNELKKLTTRTKEREDLEKSDSKKVMEEGKKEFCEDLSGGISVDLNENENEKEKTPLLSEEKENCGVVNSNIKEKQRRIKRNGNLENIGISVDLKKVVGHSGESSMQVRTNPPSPQCFSAPRGPLRPAKATCPTLLKPSKSMPTERGILQEVEQNNNSRLAVITNESSSEGNDDKVSNKSTSTVTGTTTEEARSLDLFWFFKPCTNFST